MNARETLNPVLCARDLPRDVLEQLGIPDSEEVDIVAAMRDYGGTLDISEIIVAMFKKYGRTQNRNALGAVLARMCKMGVLSRIKVGEYRVNDPDLSRMTYRGTDAVSENEADKAHEYMLADAKVRIIDVKTEIKPMTQEQIAEVEE